MLHSECTYSKVFFFQGNCPDFQTARGEVTCEMRIDVSICGEAQVRGVSAFSSFSTIPGCHSLRLWASINYLLCLGCNAKVDVLHTS